MKLRGPRSFRTAFLTLALLGALPFLSPAQAPPPADQPFRADRILLKPKANCPPADLARLHTTLGTRCLRRFKAIDQIEVLQLPPRSDLQRTLSRYRQSDLVEFAELDYWIHPAIAPNDPSYLNGSLWHLHNTGQNSGLPDADIDAPEAWDTLHAADNIIVAIVDTGVRYTHEDLAANMWVNPGEIPANGIDDDRNGFIDDIHGINAAANSGDPIDLDGHGTSVAGAAGAVGNNGRGGVGVAWQVQIMACRFYNDAREGSVSDAVQAIDYARNQGAHIINASFVFNAFSSTLQSAIRRCRNAGILFVTAAGNDAKNNDTTPSYPASYTLDNILSVAATTRTDALASYSNFGLHSVDLAAPGSSLYLPFNSDDSTYVINGGTSFAAPLVAGTLALLKARYPSETYQELIDRLLEATDPLPDLQGKTASGGRLNLSKAIGFSVDPSPATLEALPLTAQGQFQFLLTGAPNQNYTIQTTTNFLFWAPLSTNITAADGTFIFSPPQPQSSPSRFFRALQR